MKLIAFYLPQFHEIEENNNWWGKGFTEWVNVKKAKKLFSGHYQPREPYHDNYYNLLNEHVMESQSILAKKYGIYGFCFYHYWFNGKMVLEKPTQMLLKNKNIDIPFCFCWANEPWTRTWHGAGGEKEVLIRQSYGDKKDWKEHFQYLLQFFQDDRYIKKENKPVFLIYRTGNMNNVAEMFEYWHELAIENGFDGIHLVSMLSFDDKYIKNKYIEGTVDFEPGKTTREKSILTGRGRILKDYIIDHYNKIPFGKRFLCNILDYDQLNKEMVNKQHKKNEYRGVFVNYDDSPRRGIKGTIVLGSTPKKFEQYLSANIKCSIEEGNEYLFINAWNEWGESNYLEPDKRYGYAYLHAVKRAFDRNTIHKE